MPKQWILLILCAVLSLSGSVTPDTHIQGPLFLVHFMPWYQTPEVSGYWGWHWTMNHFDPSQRDEQGRRQIASHYYPVTGPYDSRDDHILEYQVLLMKISGVDGVIVDWYGMENFRDYGVLHAATRKLISYTNLAKLLFSVCYEDQTVGHMVNDGFIDADDGIDHGQQVMQYLADNWFHSNRYAALDGRPLLLNFGPQYFHASSEWEQLFSGLDPQPAFFTLDNRLAPVAEGAFPWPPMWASVDGVLTQDALNSYLSAFYAKSASWNYAVAGAFPAFHDIYEQAGLGYSYGYLDPRDGATFETTLQTAVETDPDVVQIITWNDYGEGTIVEPTLEFGLRYLEMIQDAKRVFAGDGWVYTKDDLNLPYRFYQLRKRYEEDPGIDELLTELFDMIVFEEIDEARALIDSLDTLTPAERKPEALPREVFLAQNFPNPFNPVTEIGCRIPKHAPVRLTIYNLAGQKIATLVDGVLPPGAYRVLFHAQALPSGVYFYRLQTPGFSETRKMILLP